MMDNDEIKRIFDGLKEDMVGLKKEFKESVKEGMKEHKEIKDALSKLCDRMTSSESTLDNHLLNSARKAKSNKEKISYVITGISIIIALVSVFAKFT